MWAAPAKRWPFPGCILHDPSPWMIMFPKLSEVLYWNSASSWPALPEKTEAACTACFHSTDKPQPPKGTGSRPDAVEISLGKSHKPVRNLTSFAFSDWITDRFWFSFFPLQRQAREWRKAKLPSIFRRNVLLLMISLVLLCKVFLSLNSLRSRCVSVSCYLKQSFFLLHYCFMKSSTASEQSLEGFIS